MGDKLPSGISVLVNFTEGEIPTPAKLGAITSQLQRAATQVEKAIGDIHGESWPYTAGSTTLSPKWAKHPSTGNNLSGTAERRLDIANVARLIGPASNLNPRQFNGARSVTDVVPVGVHEFQLRYPVSGAVASVTTTDPSMTDHRGSATDLQNAGDWHVTKGGKVRTVTATAGGTITYATNSSEWAGGMNPQQSAFNVIPDPNQIAAGGDGCSIGALDGNGRRPVTLPTCTHQQSDIDGTSITLGDEDINYGEQLLLPRILRDNLTTGDEIPVGFLYLKNETTGEVYEDAEYYYNSTSSVLVGNADLTAAIAAGNKFSIITIGSDITSSIDDLRVKTARHAHDRSFGEPFIHISDIIGQFEKEAQSGVFGPSEMPGNYFPQYLHRDGFRTAYDTNINDCNAMRGDILFGVETGGPGSYVNVSGDTFGIYFGDADADGAWIRKAGGLEDLQIFSGGRNLILEVDNDVVSETASTSKVIQVKGGPLESEWGFRAPFSSQKGAVHNTFCLQGFIQTHASSGDPLDPSAPWYVQLTSGGQLADVEDYHWADVRLYMRYSGFAGSETLWWPAFDNTNLDKWWLYYWDRPVNTSRLWVAHPGNDWPASTNVEFSLVITYLPS